MKLMTAHRSQHRVFGRIYHRNMGPLVHIDLWVRSSTVDPEQGTILGLKAWTVMLSFVQLDFMKIETISKLTKHFKDKSVWNRALE